MVLIKIVINIMITSAKELKEKKEREKEKKS